MEEYTLSWKNTNSDILPIFSTFYYVFFHLIDGNKLFQIFV